MTRSQLTLSSSPATQHSAPTRPALSLAPSPSQQYSPWAGTTRLLAAALATTTPAMPQVWGPMLTGAAASSLPPRLQPALQARQPRHHLHLLSLRAHRFMSPEERFTHRHYLKGLSIELQYMAGSKRAYLIIALQEEQVCEFRKAQKGQKIFLQGNGAVFADSKQMHSCRHICHLKVSHGHQELPMSLAHR